MVQLRLAPSGPPIVGQNDGDLLVWNATTQEWDITTGAAGRTAWDFIIEDIADFPNAPAAGFIDLDSGSYAIKAGVDIGANALRVAPGVDVLIKGMGNFNEKLIQSSHATATLIIESGGGARCETLNLDNSVGDGVQLQGSSALQSVGCQFSATGRGIVLDGEAGWWDVLSRVSGIIGLDMQGQDCNLSGTRIGGLAGVAVQIVGALIGRVQMSGVNMQTSNAAGVIVNTSTGDVDLIDCTINSLVADSPGCIHVLEASSLQVIGGQWRTQAAARGNGLNIAGNIPGGLQVIGVAGEDISTSDGSGEAFIKYTSGLVNRATVQGCNTASTVSTAINWPAANIPTCGLLVVGNTWNDATPYVGFVSTDARVNVKANSNSAGLMTETAIVP